MIVYSQEIVRNTYCVSIIKMLCQLTNQRSNNTELFRRFNMQSMFHNKLCRMTVNIVLIKEMKIVIRQSDPSFLILKQHDANYSDWTVFA